jgi:hypothetical protein
MVKKLETTNVEGFGGQSGGCPQADAAANFPR